MKYRIGYILFICLFSSYLHAQVISLDPNPYVIDTIDVDLTDQFTELSSVVSITNNTSDSIALIWTRKIDDTCPEEWDFFVYDNLQCYFHTVFSNVSEELGINNPFILKGGETFSNFIMYFYPSSMPGCCNVKIEFAYVDDPGVIIDVIDYKISVNTPECIFDTSTLEITEARLVAVFPNPTMDQFTLSNNDVVNQIDVYNSLGQKLKTFDFVNGEYHNISDLNTGLYSLVLKNADSKTLHTLMLDKI